MFTRHVQSGDAVLRRSLLGGRTQLARILLGDGAGILILWLASAIVNNFYFHRFGWFFAQTHDFLYSGILLAFLGAALRAFLYRRKEGCNKTIQL